MVRKILVAVVIVLAIVGALAGVKALQIGAMSRAQEKFSIPPETVSSAEVRQESWETTLPAVGSVTAVQGTVLRAELAGTVRKIAFESGDTARAGALLVQLDTSAEQAQLRAAEAQAELARLNLARARDLRAQDLIAQSELDSKEAEFRQTSGAADNIRATIEKKTIRAPFTGRLGIRSVNLGQFVNVGDPIVSLQSLDPVFVDFTVPEQQLGGLRPGMPVRLTTDAATGRTFSGRLTALNPDIDPATRNIKLQATLPNPGGVLRPGMFARVEVVRPEKKTLLVVPATAVLHAPYGDSVFVIADTPAGKTGTTTKQARMTTVRVGETRGDFVSIQEGVEAGQTIVASGVFKLRNGSPVVVNNRLTPAAETNPHPADS